MKWRIIKPAAKRFRAGFETGGGALRRRQSATFLKQVCLCLGLVWMSALRMEGQTVNSWTLPASGKWEGATNWSLGVAPAGSQFIFITNAGSDLIVSGLPAKQVIIDDTTSSSTNVMTVMNLTLYGAGSNVVNWLTLTNAGTNVPLRILSQVTMAAGGQLSVEGSSLQVDGQLAVGAQTPAGFTANFPALLSVNSGSAQVGTLLLGPASNAVGTLSLSGGTLVVTNLGIGNNGATNVGAGTGTVTVAGDATVSVSSLSLGSTAGGLGSLLLSNGTLSVSSNLTIVSSSLMATSTVTILGGSLLASNSLIQVGPNGAGLFTISGGDHVIRRLKLGGVDATNSSGEFVISGGKLRILGNGTGPGNGLVVNSADFEGGDTDGTGTSVTIGDAYSQHAYMRGGSAQFTAMYVGSTADGTYSQVGGSMTILSNLMVGTTCPASLQDAIGTVDLSGGWLFITNDTHTAVLDVRNGTFTLNPGGVLVVDNLVATNPCGQFINNGGIILPGNALYSGNLLLNSGAEGGNTSDWTANGNPATYVAGFFPRTGQHDFFASDLDLMQSVNLQEYQDLIEKGRLLAGLSFWELTLPGATGNAKVRLDFLDASSVLINSISTPALTSEGQWGNDTSQYDIPAGTRSVNYTISFGGSGVYVDDNLLFVSVYPSPPLSVVKAGDNVVLSWPAWAANFVLQHSTSLAPKSWTDVTVVPLLASGRFFVISPIAGPGEYYRLRGK